MNWSARALSLAPRDPQWARNIRWWVFFSLLQVFCHVVLSSVGAFFHFLMNHGINLVEGWLHNNGWELVIAAKLFALWATHRLLSVRLYRPRGIGEFLRDEFRWPSQKVLVISAFLLVALLALGKPVSLPQNHPYWLSHISAYLGVLLWFLSDIVMAAILHELFPITTPGGKRWRLLVYLLCFALSFRLVVPDYFGTAFVVHLHFFMALFLAGSTFRRWGDSVTYMVLVAAPATAFLGLDPIWGADFSPFKLTRPPAAPFLLALWVLSWAYYSYRHRWRRPL